MGEGGLTTALSPHKQPEHHPRPRRAPSPPHFRAMPHQCNQADCNTENSTAALNEFISSALQSSLILPGKAQSLLRMLQVQEEAGQAATRPGHPPSQPFMPPRGRAAGIRQGCATPGTVVSVGKGQCTVKEGSGVCPLQLCRRAASCVSLLSPPSSPETPAGQRGGRRGAEPPVP